MSSPKKITLKSCDGEAFEVDKVVAMESLTIKHMIEDDCADAIIPVPNVTSKILSKVIKYSKKHVESSSTIDVDLKTWDADFVNVDQNTLFNLILAAHFLDIKNLLDLTCRTVADMLEGKTPGEMRKIFNITNDFTPEEEEKIRTDRRMHGHSSETEKAHNSCLIF